MDTTIIGYFIARMNLLVESAMSMELRRFGASQKEGLASLMVCLMIGSFYT
jgi:hypothetical protein